MGELLHRLAIPWRACGLALWALWHMCLREDWTEDQFSAALAEIRELSLEYHDG